MNAGQYDLRTTLPGKAVEFSDNGLRRGAFRSAAGERDDAIGTTVIAPVLDFKEPPRPALRRVDRSAPLGRRSRSSLSRSFISSPLSGSG